MSGLRRRILGLCLVPLLFCALDGTVTLIGQVPEYWVGNYEAVREGSPTFNHLLRVHPAAFVGGLSVWAIIFVSIILLVPDTLALICSLVVTIAHAVGAATWLLFRFEFGYQACNALFFACAVLLGLALRFGWGAKPAVEYRLERISPFARWLLVAILFSVGVYLFVWPRTP